MIPASAAGRLVSEKAFEKKVLTGEMRKVLAAARYGIRPSLVDEISPGEMAVMLVVDRVIAMREAKV